MTKAKAALARKIYERTRKTAPLGSGERFSALTKALAARGARNPRALAAYIGRRKYGAKRFAQLAAKGRQRRAHKSA